MKDNFAQIVGYTDKLELVRAVLTYPLINWTSQFFSRTRDGKAELYFVGYCRAVIKQRGDELSKEEVSNFDQKLLRYELNAYDLLNMWREYIDLHDIVVERYPDFKTFRYDKILRKLERQKMGKSVEHLKKHQQSQLSDDELESRYMKMVELFEFIKQQHP
jgi:CRISPR/Cas system CMR-associated protein Cmr3 (group 5 of RAMP superfamily)